MSEMVKSWVMGAGLLFSLMVPGQEIQESKESQIERRIIEVATSSKVFTPKVHGTQKQEAIIGAGITGFINSRTTMRGASIPWDAKRLIEGKFKKFEAIGGEPLLFHTRVGDQISAFYFDVKNFHQKIDEMGGKLADVELHIDHPFFERVKPVTLSKPGKAHTAEGLRIPYDPMLESEFKNPKEFLEFCQKMGYQLFWEDSLKPFETASWYHFSSMQQNLVLVSKFDTKVLGSLSFGSGVKVEDAAEIGEGFTFFRDKPITSKAIVFDHRIDEVEKLLAINGLKIENSSWKMVQYKDKLYLLENPDFVSALALSDMKGIEALESFRLKTNPIREPNLDADRAAVVLSMNQTDSFAAYSHEILTFLFLGMNVLVYDNAGKGLSRGNNSQEGMTEAIRSAGRYLIEEKNLRENQILFKGQCAGGLPTSEAAKLFPSAHIWVDQAPQTFSGTVKNIVIRKAEEMGQTSKNGWLKTFKSIVPILAPVVSQVSSLILPNYDVVEGLKENKGAQIYTIGVPDGRGNGGDQMVPIEHREAIKEALLLNPKGHYLEMVGGTHVTDWWVDPKIEKSIRNIFERLKLNADVFPEKPSTAGEAIEKRFENFFNKRFDPSGAVEVEQRVHALYEAVAHQDFDAIKYTMNWVDSVSPDYSLGLQDQLLPETHAYVVNDMVDLSRELGYKLFTQKLLMAKREGAL